MRRIALVVCFLGLSHIVQADSLPVGTWVQRRAPGQSASFTMTVEAAGNGRKLTYNLVGADAPAGALMTVLTQLDGKDAPVLIDGKPSGQTMGIRMIDSRDMFTILKFQGNEIGTSKSEVSVDGKVIKVENMMTTPGGNAEGTKSVEYWDKK